MRLWAAFITGRRTKFVVLGLWVVILGIASQFGSKLFDVTEDSYRTFLPSSAESTAVAEAEREFPGGQTDVFVIVYERDGGITPADQAKAEQDLRTLRESYQVEGGERALVPAEDGEALLAQVAVSLEGARDIGVTLTEAAEKIRETVGSGGDGLTVNVTGSGALTSDTVAVLEDLELTLLLVPVVVVAVLLLLIYRSPILFIPPLIAVAVGNQLGSAVVYGLVEGPGLILNSLGAGVLGILVYGAGTDYALLLIARYREELRQHEDRHEAMRQAILRSGPAIIASAGTVAVGLLCLFVADQASTRSLGPVGALAVGAALLSMLSLLPALLLVLGRWVFWPVVPRPGAPVTERRGIWERVAAVVSARPRAIWVGSVVVLGVLALGLVRLDSPQQTFFRSPPDSVQGAAVIAEHYSAGAGNPIVVIAPADRADEVQAAIRGTEGVTAIQSVSTAGDRVRLQALVSFPPNSPEEYQAIERLRDTVNPIGAIVGGNSASELDKADAGRRDATVIIPLVLIAVLLILCLLLRALVLPVLLVATVALSFAAALGLSVLIFEDLFSWRGQEAVLPIQAFVFLVALGVDYNIFLMSRVREESLVHGTRAGTLRGLVVTGGVITSAGVVLAATFAVLAVLPVLNIAQLGFVVALGVLLDTFLVRSLLVPALTLDIGRKVWWPSRLARDPEPEPASTEPALTGKH